MALLDVLRGRARPAPAPREPAAPGPGVLSRVRHLTRLVVVPHEGVQRTCLRCGRCCEAFGAHLHASKADLERWRRLGRDDLLRRVGPLTGWIWLDPGTGTLEDACPFLVTTGPDTKECAIQDVKPDMCRDYPTLAHGRRCLRGFFLAWVAAVLAGSPLLPALLAAGAG